MNEMNEEEELLKIAHQVWENVPLDLGSGIMGALVEIMKNLVEVYRWGSGGTGEESEEEIEHGLMAAFRDLAVYSLLASVPNPDTRPIKFTESPITNTPTWALSALARYAGGMYEVMKSHARPGDIGLVWEVASLYQAAMTWLRSKDYPAERLVKEGLESLLNQ